MMTHIYIELPDHDKTLDDLGRNVKPVNDGSRASAGAHSVTASWRSISQQYRWAWCTRPESVGHSKPATLSASAREREVMQEVWTSMRRARKLH